MNTEPLGRKQISVRGVVQGVDTHPGRVVLRTALGARRIVDMPVGEQLPRIC